MKSTSDKQARLIAEAPKMLKLLKKFVQGEEAKKGCTCKWCSAIRLIARATGVTP